MSVVVNETQLAEFVHEVTHARPSRADHLSERLLTYVGENLLLLTFISKIGQQQQ
jgi:hypothetical protein